MKACVYEGNPEVRLRELPTPELKDIVASKKYGDEKLLLNKKDLVLLKVEVASICGTDLHILMKEHGSSPPVILGHEYIGRVIDTGEDVAHIKKDDCVAVDPNIKCGYCDYCRKGLFNMCVNLTTLGIFVDGGFAEFNLAPAKQLYRLPSDLPVERAVLFEAVSCVMHGLTKVKPMAGENVLVFGAGPIGCYFTALCKLNGALNVTVVEPHSFRANFVKSLGARPVSNILDLKKEQFNIVVDASGDPEIVPHAFQSARPGGRVLLFGQQNVNAKVSINPTLVNQKELQVYGSYATATSFEDTLRVLTDSRFPCESLITHRVALDDIVQAFDVMKAGNAIKVLISPS